MSEHEHSHETCRHLLSSLGDYVDGTLSDDLCAELEKHMKGCDRCQIVVNTMKKTIDLYHEAAEENKMPSDVRKRLYARLSLEEFIK